MGQLEKQEQENGFALAVHDDLGLMVIFGVSIYSQGRFVTVVRREWGECR